MEYFSLSRVKAPIVIADASSPEMAAQVEQAVAARHDLSIILRCFPEETHQGERLLWLAQQVSTEFVIWQGDDDFVVPEWIDAAADLMRARPDASVVVGSAWVFSVASDAVHGKITGYGPYEQLGIDATTACDRLLAHATRFATICYGLQRTANFHRSMELNVKPYGGPYPYLFPELLDGGLAPIRGRIVKIDNLSLFRQVHKQSTSTIQSRTPYHEIITDASWGENMNRVTDAWRAALVEVDDISSQQALAVARRAAAMFWARTLTAKLTPRRSQMAIIRAVQRGGRGVAKIWKPRLTDLVGRDVPVWSAIRRVVETG